ncbi:MAG: ArdC family protein [Acidiferrobacterales bacterium]
MAISKKELLAGLVERVHRILDTGDVPPWQKPWNPDFGDQSAPFNPVTKRAYAGLNRLDLALSSALAGYADPRWMGYRQAAVHGWRVRAGERAAYVHLPVEIHRAPDPERARTRSDVDTAPDSKSPRTILVFKRVPVFNAAQIDGLPPLARVPPEPSQSRCAELDSIARHMGVAIQECPRDRAVYIPVRDHIELPPRSAFPDLYGYDSTKAHELAHATGHPQRLNRDLRGAFGSARYAAEEVTAEIGSFLMCQELAIPYQGGNPDLSADQHAAYLASWATVLTQDPKALGQAIDQGARAATYLTRQLAQSREPDLVPEQETSGLTPERGRGIDVERPDAGIGF